MTNYVIGVDVGGSHITAAVVDLATHQIVENSIRRVHVDSKNSSEEILEKWIEAILGSKESIANTSNKIGISMPGPCDYEQGVCLVKGLDKYEALYNLNIKELLSEKMDIEIADIQMMNDATCFLKGELFGGSVAGFDNVIGITLGTGLGSCAYIKNCLFEGDLYCMPWKDRFAEDYLSTRWFLKEYKDRTGLTAKNVKELHDLALSDQVVQQIFYEFGKNLGEVLLNYLKKYPAQTIVIGGNINNAWNLFIPTTDLVLKNGSLNVQLIKSPIGESAALLGAASLFNQVN